MAIEGPKCYGCDRKARHGSLFCTQKCAAEWAEEIILGNEEVYCYNCKEWHSESRSAECVGRFITMDEWLEFHGKTGR